MYQRLWNQSLGVPPNLEDDNASTNVSINDNDSGKFSEGVSDEREAKQNLWTKRKINVQEEALRLEKRKIKLMEERLVKKPQADEDEVRMFLMCLLPSIKKNGRHSRLELRIEFLSSVTRRIQISKNLSPPFNSVTTESNSSCPPTPSPRAVNLDSTHSRDSDRTVQRTLRISCI